MNRFVSGLPFLLPWSPTPQEGLILRLSRKWRKEKEEPAAHKKKKYKKLLSSNQGELNEIEPSTLGQEEEVEQLAKELDLSFSSEDSAFESDMDDLL